MADLNIKKVTVSGVNYDIEDSAARELANSKSTVSVSASGTATDTVQYITVDGVEKKLAGSSGEPDAYLKNATTSGNTLTLTKKDNSTVTFTPTEVAVVGASTNEENDVGETVKIWIDTTESYAELDNPEIVQVPGQSTMKVMSQKAVTDEIATKSTVSVSDTGTATAEVQYITIDGVEKKIAGGGSGGEPAAYLKSASVSGNTLTLTKKDNTTVVYTPTEQYQGTVKSVAAGTGLNISGTATTSPTVNIASGYKLPTTTEWGNKLDKNSSITGATKTKITYDSNGLVTAGADLAASDIPNLAASKITSGTFADARIASASTWNAKQDALTASNNITIDASNNISALKYYKQSEVTGVAGTSTTQLSSTYNVTDSSVTSYYDGMLVTFVLPVAGTSMYGSVFQFNSLGYHPIVYGTNSIVGTRYPVGGQITMIYNSVQTASAYLTKNTKTTITGCWQVCDYDTSTTDARKVFDYYLRPYVGANALYRYKLCALDKDNRVAPITITNQESATQVAKTPNSVGLKTGDLWFYTSSSNISSGKAVGAGSLATTYYGDNMCQYNFNASISAYRMIYLRGTYNTTTGLFTLYNDGSSPCTSYYTVVPNNTANITLSSYFVSGYYYWLVGSSYSTADYLQVFGTNPLYYFDGTNLVPYQEHLIAGKQDVSTLEADVAAKGFTKNTGTITGITMNGSSKGTSGVVNLGTVITAHQDISGKEDVANKTTTLSSSSTDTQYPSAKVVYDGLTTANWNLIKTTQSLPISFEYGYAIRTGAYNVGQVVDLTPETNANMAYSIIDCVPEVSFLLNLTGGWTPRAWAFLDTDNKLLKASGTNAVCGNLVLQAPAAATKFVVNATIGTIGDCYINWLQGDLDHLDTKTLVYIRGVGYSTTSNITGEGQYYVHTSERTLKKVISYANGAVALDVTMPFSIHTLYYYNGALYKYSGSNNFDGLIRISSDACRPQTLDSYVYQIKNVIDTVGESNFYNKVLTLTEANGYNSWPIISYCGNELVCCYSRGTQHVDSTSGTYYKTSPNGIVWSTEKTLLDTPAARENATGKGFDANGNTLFWIRINSTFSLYKYSSGTWSVVCSGVTVGSFGHIGDIMNADGTLVCFWCDYNYTDGQKYGVARSTDNGVTWTFTELAVSSTIDLPTETQGVYLGNGRLLAIGRKDNDGGTYANMQLQSTDYGATWTKAYTNITDVQRSTTSMIYDSATDTVYAYYCNRSNGQFLCRQATVSTVWDNPTNWPASTLIAIGSYPDGGNANVVEKDGKHYLSYYSSEDTERTMICTYVRTVSADNLLAHVESFDSSTATLNLT